MPGTKANATISWSYKDMYIKSALTLRWTLKPFAVLLCILFWTKHPSIQTTCARQTIVSLLFSEITSIPSSRDSNLYWVDVDLPVETLGTPLYLLFVSSRLYSPRTYVRACLLYVYYVHENANHAKRPHFRTQRFIGVIKNIACMRELWKHRKLLAHHLSHKPKTYHATMSSGATFTVTYVSHRNWRRSWYWYRSCSCALSSYTLASFSVVGACVLFVCVFSFRECLPIKTLFLKKVS